MPWHGRVIGLALGSGAARGLAHIGVLEVLEKEGIPIDMIAGTSAGALVGALYACGKPISYMKQLALTLGKERFAALADLSLSHSGLVRGRRAKQILRSALDDIQFSDLKIPFRCVAADIETGEEIVIDEGAVLEAVRASGSIPILMAAVKWGGRFLVDGALANPVPVNVVKKMGAEFIIAVNVIPHTGKRLDPAKEPGLFRVIMQTIYITTHRTVWASLEGADAVIEPHVAHIGHLDFQKAEECILQGRLAAQEAMREIRRELGV
ncbi:MAG: patatin-like phospholipase family protein [Chloroflexi bacterium]|nr:patatin-like phospholipase family protein [Chloroflexota bacterium]